MKSDLKVKYLQFLLGKKKNGNEGFTLIELLVVVIIIGVLAAVALPNLLAQVGKARETEAKTALGALNRSQQAYYLEKQKLYQGGNSFGDVLGVAPGEKFYAFNNATLAGEYSGTGTLKGRFTADAKNPANDGVRDYAAGLTYQGGTFTTILCVAQAKDTANAGTQTAGGDAATVSAKANGGDACTQGDAIQ